jgi:hypothetical protein
MRKQFNKGIFDGFLSLLAFFWEPVEIWVEKFERLGKAQLQHERDPMGFGKVFHDWKNNPSSLATLSIIVGVGWPWKLCVWESNEFKALSPSTERFNFGGAPSKIIFVRFKSFWTFQAGNSLVRKVHSIIACSDRRTAKS